jgi:DNA-binding CsgD family transcriptional regulator
MTRSATYAVERAVATATDADTLLSALPGVLQRLVGCGPVFAAAVDPATMHFTRALRTEISDQAAARFMALEIGTPDVVKFRALAGAREPVDTLVHATGRDLATSARWREVIEPLGWGDELRIACREAGRTWGVLCLHRTAEEDAYADDDIAALRQVAPLLASAFRRTAIATSPQPGSESLEPGVLLLDDELVVTSMTGAAAEWLELLGPLEGGLPIVLMSVAVQALTTGEPQVVALPTSGRRWLSVHASALHGPDSVAVAVILQPAHPLDALPTFAAAAQLTPRETDVVAAALRGLSDRAIARDLELSEYTVQDHLKRVYAKTATRGRAELIARLLGSG